MVRAKFKVESIKDIPNGKQIILWPVTDGSDENEQFFKFTPCGQIDLSTVNPEAAKQFVVGAEYYVDFTPAPK